LQFKNEITTLKLTIQEKEKKLKEITANIEFPETEIIWGTVFNSLRKAAEVFEVAAYRWKRIFEPLIVISNYTTLCPPPEDTTGRQVYVKRIGLLASELRKTASACQKKFCKETDEIP